MADDFVPSDPEFTVTIIGPNGKEYINIWKKSGQYGDYWGGKDVRGNYVNMYKFRKKEDREKPQQKPESSGW